MKNPDYSGARHSHRDSISGLGWGSNSIARADNTRALSFYVPAGWACTNVRIFVSIDKANTKKIVGKWYLPQGSAMLKKDTNGQFILTETISSAPPIVLPFTLKQ